VSIVQLDFVLSITLNLGILFGLEGCFYKNHRSPHYRLMQSSSKRRLFGPFDGAVAMGAARMARPGQWPPGVSRFAGARGGYSRRGYIRAYSRPRYRSPFTPGYNRRVGMYGRFGTGRGFGPQVEKKFFDTTLAFAAGSGAWCNSNATGALVVGLAQGTAANQRIGGKIIIKSIQIKLKFVLAPGAQDDDNFHVYLIQDTQANGAYPDANGSYFDAGGGAIGTQLRTLMNANRYRLLKHMVVNLNSEAGVATAFSGDDKQDDCFIKCNIPIWFNSNTGAITEIRSNNILIYYGSTASTATVAGVARVRYTDM